MRLEEHRGTKCTSSTIVTLIWEEGDKMWEEETRTKESDRGLSLCQAELFTLDSGEEA